MRTHWKCAMLAVALAVVAVTAPAVASAAQQQGRLHVSIAVNRMVTGARHTTAHGTVTANLSQVGGGATVLRAPVTLAVARTGSCRILHLQLEQLNLVLLGLNVHLDKVVLDVTGQPHGGALGNLFCRLARARVASARAAVDRSMNSTLRAHPLHVVAFTVPIHAAQATAGTCPVLDLILGPLNVNLLGLIVNLNQVHLSITATPGGGALGNLFCTLSH